MIKEWSEHFPIRLMCRLLGLSVSGYYAWLTRGPSKRSARDHDLAVQIKLIFDEERSRAGAPRITRRLNQEGEPVGKQRVARIMR